MEVLSFLGYLILCFVIGALFPIAAIFAFYVLLLSVLAIYYFAFAIFLFFFIVYVMISDSIKSLFGDK